MESIRKILNPEELTKDKVKLEEKLAKVQKFINRLKKFDRSYYKELIETLEDCISLLNILIFEIEQVAPESYEYEPEKEEDNNVENEGME